MKKTKTIVVSLIGLFWCSAALAWNTTGHMVVAQIAYDNLTPKTKKTVNRLTKVVAQFYPSTRYFVDSAAWLDWIKGDDVSAFSAWHYINLPYKQGKVRVPAYSSQNIVWAIGQSEQVLQSRRSNDAEKSFFLRVLVHLVGDIHQPLHCATLYSKQYPQGDAGGNLYPIKGMKAKNLHSLWDGELGLFKSYQAQKRYLVVRHWAKVIEQKYPKSYFGDRIKQQDPQQWAQHSHQLAIQYAYKIGRNKKPSTQYIINGQQIVEQQMALAGYRLAYYLNGEKL